MDRDIALNIVSGLDTLKTALNTLKTNTTPVTPSPAAAGLSLSPIATLGASEPDSPSVEPVEPETVDK